jgi:hypothetical protein
VAYSNTSTNLLFDAAGYFTRTDPPTAAPPPGNADPTALPVAVNVAVGGTTDIELGGAIADADGDPVAIVTVTQPGNGSSSVVDSHTIRFNASSAPGIATFTYTVSDGRGGTATAAVTANVQAAGAPSAPTNLQIHNTWFNPADQTPTVSVRLTWGDAALGTAGYRINVVQDGLGPTFTKELVTLPPGSTEATVTPTSPFGRTILPNPQNSFHLEVVAYNAQGSGVAAAPTILPPTAPKPIITRYSNQQEAGDMVSWTVPTIDGWVTRTFKLWNADHTVELTNTTPFIPSNGPNDFLGRVSWARGLHPCIVISAINFTIRGTQGTFSDPVCLS